MPFFLLMANLSLTADRLKAEVYVMSSQIMSNSPENYCRSRHWVYLGGWSWLKNHHGGAP